MWPAKLGISKGKQIESWSSWAYLRSIGVGRGRGVFDLHAPEDVFFTVELLLTRPLATRCRSWSRRCWRSRQARLHLELTHQVCAWGRQEVAGVEVQASGPDSGERRLHLHHDPGTTVLGCPRSLKIREFFRTRFLARVRWSRRRLRWSCLH